MVKKIPREYKIELPYGEAHLEILLFSDVEHRWIFTHNYLKRETDDGRSKPMLTNKTRLVVNYDDGIAAGIELSMDIKRPDKRGKVYWHGLDISPESHLFVEFCYEKQGELFRMKTIQTGIGKRFDLEELSKGNLPVKPIEFPFPLRDRVEHELGDYNIPYLANNETVSFFRFPRSYRK